MRSLIPTVFVVAPDVTVCASIEGVSRRAGWITKTFASTEAFLASAPALTQSCLLLETGRPNLPNADAVRSVALARRATPVIAVAGDSDVAMTVQVMKAGAIECLTKPLAEEILMAAISQAIARSRTLLDEEAESLDLRRRYTSLSSRERDVMARVVGGCLNKQIGAALGISEITVKAHRGKVMRKMQAQSLAELVTMAIRLRLPVFSATPVLIPPHAKFSVMSLTGSLQSALAAAR